MGAYEGVKERVGVKKKKEEEKGSLISVFYFSQILRQSKNDLKAFFYCNLDKKVLVTFLMNLISL